MEVGVLNKFWGVNYANTPPIWSPVMVGGNKAELGENTTSSNLLGDLPMYNCDGFLCTSKYL